MRHAWFRPKLLISCTKYPIIAICAILTSCSHEIPSTSTPNTEPLVEIAEANHPLLEIIPGYRIGELCVPGWQIENLEPPEFYLEHPPVDSGIGIGLTAEDIPGAVDLGPNTYQVPMETSINGSLHFIYAETEINSIPLPLRIYTLLDETVVDDAFGPNTDEFLDTTMQPGSVATLTLHIPPLSAGVHDLIIFAMTGWDRETDPYGDFGFASFRASLVAGDSPTLIPRQYIRFPFAQQKPSPLEPGIALILSTNPEEPKAWSWPETRLTIADDGPFEFYAYTGYDLNAEGIQVELPAYDSIALLAFLDYHHVAIGHGSTALYVQLTADTAYARIPIELDIPPETGPHDVMILRINNPGVQHCRFHDPNEEYWFYPGVYANRVGIALSD